MTRIIRVTKCAECPKMEYAIPFVPLPFCFAIAEPAPIMPDAPIPEWCPLEVETVDTAKG